MSKSLRTNAYLLLLFCLVGGFAGCSGKQEYPARPITLICPWSAGGGTDRVARQIALQLEREIGVPLNVVNATGGGGVSGHMRGAIARPDGYTITLATAELNILHWRDLTSVTYKDFQPLVQVNRDDAALLVHKDAPWQNAQELAEAIRNNPRVLRASGTAFGGIWHLSLVGWLHSQGIPPGDLIWVSINGATPSLQEMIAERLEVVCCSLPEARALLDGGMVRALAVMSDERIAGFEDVPTLREQGIDWSMGTWRGLMLPPNVQSERVALLSEKLEKVVGSEEYRDFMHEAGFVPVMKNSSEFSSMLGENDARLGEILEGPVFSTVQNQQIDVMFFPMLIGIGLVLAMGTAVCRGELRMKDQHAEIKSVGVSELVKAAGVVGFVAAYVLMWEVVGFVISTAIALLLCLLALRVRAVTSIIIAVVTSVVVYHAFAVLLRVTLPWGWLGW